MLWFSGLPEEALCEDPPGNYLVQKRPDLKNFGKMAIALLMLLTLTILTQSSPPNSRSGPSLLTSPFSSSARNIFHSKAPAESVVQLANWLTDSRNSHNCTLSLHFRTNQSSGLILYADQLHSQSYLQISLVDNGQLEVRIQLAENGQLGNVQQHHLLMNLGPDLNDDRWHCLLIDKLANLLTLRLLNLDQQNGHVVVEKRTLPTNVLFSESARVFLMGVPKNVSMGSDTPSNSAVEFQPKFRGSIKNVRYQTFSGKERRPNILRIEGVLMEREEPICLQDILPRPLFVHGEDVIKFHLPALSRDWRTTLKTTKKTSVQNEGNADLHSQNNDRIAIHFQTYARNAFLLAGRTRGVTVFTLFIEDGLLRVIFICPANNIEQEFHNGHGGDFYDFHDHHLIIDLDRLVKTFSIKVDGILRFHKVIPDDCKAQLRPMSEIMLAGGGDSSKVGNFQGKITQFLLFRDAVEWNLLGGTRRTNTSSGGEKVTFDCLLNSSYSLSNRSDQTKSCKNYYMPANSTQMGNISFWIKTRDAHGLLFFQSSDHNQFLIGLDMYDGLISAIFRRPSSTSKQGYLSTKFTLSFPTVNDGNWHHVTLAIAEQVVKFKVDDSELDFLLSPSKPSTRSSQIFIGESIPIKEALKFSEIWSAQKGVTFSGCLANMTLNERKLDGRKSGVRAKQRRNLLKNPVLTCDDEPCLNEGVCRDALDGFSCDCIATAFIGPLCQSDATKMDFDGNKSKRVDLANAIYGRQLTDISFRFRTSQSDCFLLEASCSASNDSIEFLVQSGLMQMTLKSGHLKHPVQMLAGENVGDDRWHSVIFSRKGGSLELAFDRYPHIENVPALDSVELLICTVEIGMSRQLKNTPNLNGTLQQVLIDGRDLLQPDQDSSNLSSNNLAFTFLNSSSFVAIHSFKLNQKLDVKFSIKTNQRTGLLMYSGKPGHDFIALELLHGSVQYSANLGSGLKLAVSKKSIADNLWHSIHLARAGKRQHSLRVDEEQVKIVHEKNQSKLNLPPKIYLGGLPSQLNIKLQRTSRTQIGFAGCISQLEINRHSYDLLLNASEKDGAIVRGCHSLGTEDCLHGEIGTCHNGGVCGMHFGVVDCDCDMTSFNGATCSEYSVTYKFGPLPGLIIYHFDAANRPDTRADRIAFGVVTLEDEAVLAHISSFTSDDNTEFQMVGGHMFVVYNMGSEAHLISDLKHAVNDGKYHIVRFERNGPNATLQVDDKPIISKTPSGRQLDVFNGISTIEIGGKLNSKTQQMERTFTGLISGFVVNGIRILDLAADNDANILIEGYPELVSPPETAIEEASKTDQILKGSPNWMDDMQLTQTTHSAENADKRTSDDLFKAVDDTICPDEGESCITTDSSTKDNLIFAQYTLVKSGGSPSTTTASSVGKNTTKRVMKMPCDNDDEDCDMESSGYSGNIHSARSVAAPKITRPPIIINVTFTTLLTPPALVSTIISSSQPSSPTPFHPSKIPVLTAPIVPTVHTSHSTSTAEQIAIVAGGAIGLLILIALIIFCMLRKKKSSTPVESTTTRVAKEKTYETFAKPEPSPTTSTLRKNNPNHAQVPDNQFFPANVAAAMGTFSRNSKSTSDKECYV